MSAVQVQSLSLNNEIRKPIQRMNQLNKSKPRRLMLNLANGLMCGTLIGMENIDNAIDQLVIIIQQAFITSDTTIGCTESLRSWQI